jgi:NADH-quinone oxidoreductase subunit G
MKRVEAKLKTPLLSSCCPSWIEYAEEFIPSLISDISSVKSPQQLMGRLIKYHLNPKVDAFNLYTVSFMTCVANKSEAARELNTQKGISETDAVITVREFLRMLRSYGISLGRLKAVNPEEPYLQNSSAALQMGYVGGKAEAIATQINFITNGMVAGNFKFSPPKNPGSRKEVKVKIGKTEYGFAWVNTIAEAQKYLDYLKAEGRTDIHYVEVMACPGGCAGGGGQPTFMKTEKQKLRKKMIQEMEKTKKTNVAGLNEDLNNITQKFKGSEAVSGFFTEFHKRDVVK